MSPALPTTTIAWTLIALFGTATILFVLELAFPAHRQTRQLNWYIRALAVNAISLGVFVLVDGLLSRLNVTSAVMDLSHLHPATGAFISYFAYTFVAYWWHRLRHHSNFLWLYVHQIHHSPERIETLTTDYIHPLDIVSNLLIGNTIVFLLFGLTLEGAAWYTMFTGIAGYLIHANLHFPRCIGYVFQTPAMHRLHHKTDHHAQNYGDFVCWDMLFGTYSNPVGPIERCGFSEAQERRLLKMMLARDVASC